MRYQVNLITNYLIQWIQHTKRYDALLHIKSPTQIAVFIKKELYGKSSPPDSAKRAFRGVDFNAMYFLLCNARGYCNFPKPKLLPVQKFIYEKPTT